MILLRSSVHSMERILCTFKLIITTFTMKHTITSLNSKFPVTRTALSFISSYKALVQHSSNNFDLDYHTYLIGFIILGKRFHPIC